MGFYERLEEYRKRLGVSQSTVEKECGLSNGAISKWKNSVPKADSLQKVADYLGVTLDYVMKGNDGTEIIVESHNKEHKTEQLDRIYAYYEKLNKLGKEKTIEYINDLLESDKYTNNGEE